MRWFAGLMALLVAFVVAGCAEPEADAELPAPADDDDDRRSRPGRGSSGDDDEDDDQDEGDLDWDNATVYSFAEEFDLTVTATTDFIRIGGLYGDGCVQATGTPFRVLGGNATATWVAQTPAAAELSFTTYQAYGDFYYEQTYGTSPLEATIGELPTAEDDSYYLFAVEAGSLASVAFEQEVHLTLAFEYEAFDELTVSRGC